MKKNTPFMDALSVTTIDQCPPANTDRQASADRLALACGISRGMEGVNLLRSLGCAVAVFTPSDLGVALTEDVEGLMVAAGLDGISRRRKTQGAT